MGHKWIIDVLADLRRFAQKNDLPLLAAQLEDASEVAATEIMSLARIMPTHVQGDYSEQETGEISAQDRICSSTG